MLRLIACSGARRLISTSARRALPIDSVAEISEGVSLLTTVAGTGVTGMGVMTGAYFWQNYLVGGPNEYVVLTGPFIEDIKVARKAFRLPFQKALMVNVNPVTYEFRLHNMSKEKVEFELPVVFTIGPILPSDDQDGFNSYCRLMQEMSANDIKDTIRGVIEGETRGLTAKLSIEEMFNGKEVFREQVVDKLAVDLRELGVRIYNANIQEMRDFDEDNKYFEYRKKRAIEMANNEARDAVATAKMSGDVAVSERMRDTRIAEAENDRDAQAKEYYAKKHLLEIEAEVAVQEAETKRARELSLTEAEQAVELRREELRRAVEERRFEQKSQQMRADIVAEASAKAEAVQREADAGLYAREKEAEGIRKTMEAQAQGLERLFESTSGDSELLKFYLGAQNGLWEQMSRYGAEAVKGMNPNMTIWNTGGSSRDASAPILDLVQGLTPMIKEVQKVFAGQPTTPKPDRQQEHAKAIKVIEQSRDRRHGL